ncbi:MAG: beta-galactosidase [Anaerolineae bacterium]|nr:beta-galactosidase [Anaerolineae bacterium]
MTSTSKGRGLFLSAFIIIVASVLLIVLGIVYDRSVVRDPFRAGAIRNPRFTSLTYGIQTFLWWDKSKASLYMDWTRLMVFSHVKQIFAWKDIEPSRGDFHFDRADGLLTELEGKGLKVVARLGDSPDWAITHVSGKKGVDFLDAPPDDLNDWGNFCGALAGRYKGRIAAYQVWNEPNLNREWGKQPPNAAGYVGLLKVCSQAIRAADPQAIIISAGLSPTGTWTEAVTPDDTFFQQMYDAGFQQYADVAGVNAPGYNFPPETSPDEAEAQGGHRFGTFRRVEDMRKIMVKNGDEARQMAILEMGWTQDHIHPDYAWFAVTEDQQADYFARAYQYAADHWRPWMGLMSAIYLPDPAWTPDREEYWWSITLGSGQIGKAFMALANMAKYCGTRTIPARDPGSPEAMGLATVVPCS